METSQFEGKKIALKQTKDGYAMTLAIHPDDIPDELMRDFVGARYGVAMVRIEDNETAKHYDNRVKQAGILGKTRVFHIWLNKIHGLDVDGEDDAVEAIRTICDIGSRTELNGNKVAQQKFDKMLAEYEKWSEEDEPF